MATVKRKGSPPVGRGRGEPSTSPRRIKTREWHREALELRKAGATLPELARRYKCAITTVADAIEREMKAIPYVAAEEMRTLHNLRLDTLFLAHFRPALGSPGDLKLGLPPKAPSIEHAGIALRILERMARLNGLDITRVVVSRGDDQAPPVDQGQGPIAVKGNLITPQVAAGIIQILVAANALTAEQVAESKVIDLTPIDRPEPVQTPVEATKPKPRAERQAEEEFEA